MMAPSARERNGWMCLVWSRRSVSGRDLATGAAPFNAGSLQALVLEG